MRVAAQRFVRRHLPNESQHLFALTLVVGVVCGLVAVAFHLAIRAAEALLIERALNARGSSWMLWVVATPTLGGLFAGAALTWLVPGARGSGIPQVKQAFAVEGGRVRLRDAVGKFIVGALQIGSGASLGREGPTVQICAGATCLLARSTALPPRNMRRLIAVGVAAGIAAAFNAPVAAVTFTIEEIVGTLDQSVLSGAVIAAALAAVIERGILGAHPVIQVDQAYGLDHPSSLGCYALLGVAAAIVSVSFTDGLLKLRIWLRGVRLVPPWAHPALGGLVTGILAVLLLRSLGVTGITGGGYDTLGRALAGQLGLRVLLALCAAKLLATVCSYSSGGAGGIFAPALFVGAMLGGAVGHLDVALLNHESRQLGAFALVGMGAVFAGTIRAPITSVLIIFEMTGGYGLVLPLMLANMTSYIIARRLRPTPIYEALLEQDGVVLSFAAPPVRAIEGLLVSDAMTEKVLTTHLGQPIQDVLELLADQAFACVPVIDEAKVVLGLISVADLRAAGSSASVETLMRPPHVIRSDVPLLRGVVRMNDLGVRQLLVVDAESGLKLVGVLAMNDVVRAHARVARAGEGGASGSRRRGPLSELRAGGVMVQATVVPGDSKVTALKAQQQEPVAMAFIVRVSSQSFTIVLPEQLNEFSSDDELGKMLLASDLARPAPSIDANADFPVIAGTMADNETEAAVVLDNETKEPIGIVTKNALARAFLDAYETPAQLASSGSGEIALDERPSGGRS